MCVYCRMSNKSRVGRLSLNFYFLLSVKPEIVVPESDSGISFSKFSVSRRLIWSCFMRVVQFLNLLCSQFQQKGSGWINKTLLLIKQQKWLSEFCVKIDRVGSVCDRKHTYLFFWPKQYRKIWTTCFYQFRYMFLNSFVTLLCL